MWSRVKLSAHIFSLEVRKFLSYRVDFWSGFLGSTIVEIAVAYFVWRAVFDARGISELNGYSFSGLMLFYLVSFLLVHVVQGQSMHSISTEIYEGGLTRYVIYPLHFVHYKLLSHLSFASVALLQLLFGVGVFLLCFGMPFDVHVSVSSMLMGASLAVLGSVLYFLMLASLELVGFWADNVWSLVVMLKMSMRMFGGGVAPLAFFPEWSTDVIRLSPFYVAGALPIELTIGRVGFSEWLYGVGLISLWIGVFSLVVMFVWNRGKYKYTGVGI